MVTMPYFYCSSLVVFWSKIKSVISVKTAWWKYSPNGSRLLFTGKHIYIYLKFKILKDLFMNKKRDHTWGATIYYNTRVGCNVTITSNQGFFV